MNKAVLIAIQPFWVFLIIAKKMGWDVPQEKTVEVRKSFPKDANWNRKSLIYCSSNKQSFNRIPKKYQPFMAKLLSKVIGKFVCDEMFPIRVFDNGNIQDYIYHGMARSCLSYDEISSYIGKDKTGFGWHISDLVIYDMPKGIGEFYQKCKSYDKDEFDIDNLDCIECEKPCGNGGKLYLKRPPQSWCYVEE